MPKPESDGIAVDHEVDVRGDICPITFARTKIALEEMEIGQVLRVLIDYPPAASNVPRSAALYGDEVLAVRQIDASEWEVLLRKLVP